MAKLDVTPDYPIRLNGFGNRQTESEGVTQRIWAKALAIGVDGEQPLVLITVDSLGIRMSMADEVAARLAKKAGIERSRVAIAFSHSHTTPKVVGACDTIFSAPIPPDQQAHIDRYTVELTDALEQVALAALADRQPAKLQWAVGNVGFAMNRRTPGGPVDHSLPMMVVRSPDDAIRAIYVTYACHCVTLSNNKISGDWAGYAQQAIEQKHPEAIALVSIGCGSDSNPDSGVTGDNTAAAAGQGAQIADEVERLLAGPLKPIHGKTSATLETTDLPLNPVPSREELTALAAKAEFGSYNAQFQLAKLDRGELLQTKIDYPVQTWAFGDSLAMVFLGGEICVDYALRLRSELDASRMWLHGYSNDFCSYIPSERLLKEGGYGGGGEIPYFALPNTLAAGLEQKIVDEVHRQVPAGFHLADEGKQSSQGKPPAETALGSFKLNKNLVIELVAAEPLVRDPVAIDFGADGRLWVAEMPDYSHEIDEEFEQHGMVKALVDRNGDGRFDGATVFADGLRFPTDVKVWRDGVIVCDAPDVIFLRDTNGDGRADERKVLLTGFATHNAQARVNSLRWGVDNWVYGSCGIFGGSITSFNGDKLELGGQDFRFQPDTGEIEAVTGRTQQGRDRDDWGNWFGCENSTLVKHYPLVNHYLARNLHVAPPAAEVFVPAGDDPTQLYPAAPPTLYKLSGPAGRPTSVCGLGVYRDDLLGAEFTGNVFVCEPVNGLVHREVITPEGVTFAGHRAKAEVESEFLASTDPWFRPVQVRTGPDGCVWIVDMHRAVIEHKRFIPEEALRELDLMAGSEQGRIYRVRPRAGSPRTVARLDKLDTPGLVASLDSPNGPQRDLAQQILVQRGDKGAGAPLLTLVANSPLAATRLQALGALEGLDQLTSEAVIAAMGDDHAQVRRHAIRLSERFVASSPAIAEAYIKMTSDSDAKIRQQVAYSLGEWNDPRAAEALASLAWTNRDDAYILSAAWSSVGRTNVGPVLASIVEQRPADADDSGPLTEIAKLAGKLSEPAAIRTAIEQFGAARDGVLAAWQRDALSHLLESMPPDTKQALLAGDKRLAAQVASISDAARGSIENEGSSDEEMQAQLRLFAACAADRADEGFLKVVAGLLGPHRAPAVQQGAIKVLARVDSPAAAELLLANWSGYTPTTRSQVLEACFARAEFLPMLLEKIKNGEIKGAHVNAVERQRLLTHADPAIRAAATEALAGVINANRVAIVAAYAPAASLAGHVGRGREVFGKHCASCHKLADQGYEVGPDLAALSTRSPVSLIESIFDPNRAVDERYQSYTAVTTDGLARTGILVSETAASIVLHEQQGKEHTLLRSELDVLQNSGMSLMPEGLEKDLQAHDVADLLAYLASLATPPKNFPGNRPELIVAKGKEVRLLAANAEIYGEQIMFEAPYQNIGYWHNQADHVAWELQCNEGREFDVLVETACAEDSAGNSAVIEGFTPPIEFVVASTGTYDAYQTTKVGHVTLPAGRHRIVVRPNGPLGRPHLMDLRGVYLVPPGTEVPQQQTEDAVTPAGAIAALTNKFVPGTPEEYVHIPGIWKLAITAAKRNEATELREILAVSLPKTGQPLLDWQAVVVGGGLINGLTQIDIWPEQRIREVVGEDDALRSQWKWAIESSSAMADNESVRGGTRYDALRMLGVDTFERRGEQLQRYLAKGVDAELQWGAVGALADMDEPDSAKALIAAFNDLAESNQQAAINGLLRSKSRAAMLQKAVNDGRVLQDKLNADQAKRLESLGR